MRPGSREVRLWLAEMVRYRDRLLDSFAPSSDWADDDGILTSPTDLVFHELGHPPLECEFLAAVNAVDSGHAELLRRVDTAFQAFCDAVRDADFYEQSLSIGDHAVDLLNSEIVATEREYRPTVTEVMSANDQTKSVTVKKQRLRVFMGTRRGDGQVKAVSESTFRSWLNHKSKIPWTRNEGQYVDVPEAWLQSLPCWAAEDR